MMNKYTYKTWYSLIECLTNHKQCFWEEILTKQTITGTIGETKTITLNYSHPYENTYTFKNALKFDGLDYHTFTQYQNKITVVATLTKTTATIEGIAYPYIKVDYYNPYSQVDFGDILLYPIDGISTLDKSNWRTEFLWNNEYQVGKNTVLKKYINDLIKLVVSRYYEHYCVGVIDEDMSHEEYKNEFKFFIQRFINIINMTYDRYSTLLDIYQNNLNNLMKDIKATSKGNVRFNDTPQDGGDYSDDNHTSNISQSETESLTAGATPIERIDEIKRKMANIMKEWSNEFDKLFIEDGNI